MYKWKFPFIIINVLLIDWNWVETVNGLNFMHSVWYWFTENNYLTRIKAIRFRYPFRCNAMATDAVACRSPRSLIIYYHPCELLIIVTHPNCHFPIFRSHFVMRNGSMFAWTHLLEIIIRSFSKFTIDIRHSTFIKS